MSVLSRDLWGFGSSCIPHTHTVESQKHDLKARIASQCCVLSLSQASLEVTLG